MRVTSAMLTRHALTSLTERAAALDQSMERLSTGRRLNRPSDDPGSAREALRVRHELAVTEGDQRRLDHALRFQEAGETALSEVTTLLQRARELVLTAGNDTLTTDTGAAIAEEMVALRDDLVRLGNTRVDDRYVFAGTNSLTKPFTVDGAGAVTYAGNDTAVTVDLGSGDSIGTTPTGVTAFQGDGDLFAAINEAVSAMRTGDRQALRGDLLSRLDAGLQQVTVTRASLGARVNQVERLSSAALNRSVALTERLSSLQDIDMAREVMESELLQTGVQATFLATTRILPLSLVDYMA